MSDVSPATRAVRSGAWWLAVSPAVRFESAVLLAHLGLALAIRTVAWPEVVTPAYLWSRGMLLYRDVKFLHTPGFIAALALLFRVFGPGTAVVRAVGIAGPLVSHALVLRCTRGLATSRRLLISFFYVVAVFASDGNAVWPVALMAILSLPIAGALTRARWFRAGVLIGSAILMKQTAAYLLAVVAAVLLFRSLRAALRVVLGACLPYALALAAFAAAGSAREMLRWTILVPFQVQEVTFAPNLFTWAMLAAAFLPTVAAATLEKTAADPAARWLLVVALGFALMSYPNFLMLQTVAALPCLAVGAARLLEIVPGALRSVAIVFVAVWSASRAAIVATSPFDGKVLFWNDDPDFNAVIARLAQFPPDARVHSELWGNVLPRSGRMPPGSVWVHPWLRWYFGVENVRERVLRSAREPGTVWVGYRSSIPDGEIIGPFAIRQSGPK